MIEPSIPEFHALAFDLMVHCETFKAQPTDGVGSTVGAGVGGTPEVAMICAKSM